MYMLCDLKGTYCISCSATIFNKLLLSVTKCSFYIHKLSACEYSYSCNLCIYFKIAFFVLLGFFLLLCACGGELDAKKDC